MKVINNFILEKLKLSSNSGSKPKRTEKQYFPETCAELKELVNKLIKERGSDADLNDIDTSNITSLSNLFENNTDIRNIKIDEWDVSNVQSLYKTFFGCENFNADISNWNVSNVGDMFGTFYGCKNFKSELDTWNVSNVTTMKSMFYNCENFNSDISDWDISKVRDMCYMLYNCKSFSIPLDKWDAGYRKTTQMFKGCKKSIIPKWYKK